MVAQKRGQNEEGPCEEFDAKWPVEYGYKGAMQRRRLA